MSFNQQNTPTIILLKGDTSQGRGQLISNINACLAIQDTVRTTVHALHVSPALLTARSSVLSVPTSSWLTHEVLA
jgi:T-complex protein 1 subunit eta